MLLILLLWIKTAFIPISILWRIKQNRNSHLRNSNHSTLTFIQNVWIWINANRAKYSQPKVHVGKSPESDSHMFSHKACLTCLFVINEKLKVCIMEYLLKWCFGLLRLLGGNCSGVIWSQFWGGGKFGANFRKSIENWKMCGAPVLNGLFYIVLVWLMLMK